MAVAGTKTYWNTFFDVSLTVQLSIILVIN